MLNNIQKHARAKTVSVELFWDENHLTITVEDDGVGFKSNEVPEFGHFGIQIMKQRSEEIKGMLEIISVPGQGTKAILQCPLDTPQLVIDGGP